MVKIIIVKYLTIAILFSIIPISLLGHSFIKIYQKEKRDSIINIQREKANLVREKAKGFIERVKEVLNILGKDKEIWIKGMDHARDYFNNIILESDYLLQLFIISPNGQEFIKVSKSGFSSLKDPYKKEILKGISIRKIYLGDFYYASNKIPALLVAVPIINDKNEVERIIGAWINLQSLSELIKQVRIGQKGSAFIIDQEGRPIAYQEERNIFLGPFVAQVVSRKEGEVEFESPRGEKFQVVYRVIPDLNWGVIVLVPFEEIYEPVKHMTAIAFRWVLVVIGLGLLISLFIMVGLINPINKLSKEMVRVSGGDLDIHIDTSRKDEIGLLTRSFNQMIRDLKEAKFGLQEAERKYRSLFENSKDMIFITSVDGKFIEINQAGIEMLGFKDKKELQECHVSQTYLNPEERERFKEAIKAKGFVKDFEVQLKRKDGRPLSCLVTASARRNDKGEVIGYEGTIKDISYRKKIEGELSKRSKEFEILNDLSNLLNQTLQLDRIIPLALERVLDLTGFEMGTIYLLTEGGEELELKYHKNYPSHLVEVVKRLRRGEGVVGLTLEKKDVISLSIDQYPSQYILPHLKKEGVKSLVGIPLMSKGEVIGAICLISSSIHSPNENEINFFKNVGNQIGMALENAKLFSAVIKAKTEWETTFDSVTDLITVRDREYRIVRANKTAFKRYGLRPEEMIGKRCFEVLYQGSHPCEGCHVTKSLETQKPVSGERFSKYLKGVFQYYTFPIYNEKGEITAVVDLAREVTEEKKKAVEQEVISNINKIMASSLDIRQVMKAIQKELKRVIEIERMTITLLDEERKGFRYFSSEIEKVDMRDEGLTDNVINLMEKTPFEQALETGSPVIVPDTAKSNSWIDQKLFKKGIRSSLVFPLEYKGRFIGTLNLGSLKPHFFSEKHFPFLHSIATGLTISVQNSILYEETKKRLSEMTLLYDILKLSASSFNLQNFLKLMMEQLNYYFQFDRLGVLLVEEKTGRLIPHSGSYNESTIKRIKELNIKLGRGITGWVAQKGEALLVNDVGKDPRYIPGEEGIRSELCVPIIAGEKVIGVIDCQSKRINAFSEDDLRLLKVVGSQAGIFMEKVRLYEEIQRSEEKYRTVIEGAYDGICIIGVDNRFQFVNKRMEEIQGYPLEELIGRDFNEFITEESRRFMTDRFMRWKRGEKLPSSFELVIRRKDGELRNVEINTKAIKGEQKGVHYIVFVKDITERKRMEEQLLQAEKLRALAEMSSGVAHDFNNALAAILGNTQILLHMIEDDEVRESLRTIEKVAKDSAHTVRRLQEFTRKRPHQELFEVEVNSIIKDAIEMAKPKWRDEAQSRGVTIQIETHFGDVPPVYATPSELREVIINMIFNAIEALPHGGKIQFKTFKIESRVGIEISDTGIGMTDEVKKKIFEPFFTTKPFTNTGLGLSMSYGIIKRFGGEIEVESKVGKGTTFRIILPVGKGKKEETPSYRTPIERKKARILVIEDEETIREVLVRTLAQVSHEVTSVENGDKGIQLFQKEKFDMVLTDLGMPGLSGWEVCRRIKEMSPGTTVGMITGWGMQLDQEKVKEVGLDFLISKPFDFNFLLQTITNALEVKEKYI
ncbi:MAG: GAF domain-containing protein [Thermodesulfobacteriota bacterium]